jgi:integrase
MAKRPDFRDWLGEFGLSPGTIDVYARDVDIANGTGPGLIARLRDDELAPKTRRRILASARRWAEYTKNTRLTEQLKRLRLPPPRRKAAKVPLAREQLFALIDELGKGDLEAPMRGVIGMMACRGFRCGDVLRLRRTELDAARAGGTLSYEAKGRRRIEFKLLKTYRRYLVQLADAPGDWDRVCDLIAPGGEDAFKKRMRAAAKAVERELVKLGTRAGIGSLHPHRLRRTYAVEYLRSMHGDPEALIKLTQHMQWASMATAMEYVDHARGAELDDVAERIFDRGDEA